MRKLSTLFFAALLCSAMAFAQATSSNPATPDTSGTQSHSAAGQNGASNRAQTPITTPRANGADRNASQVDRNVPNNPNAVNDNTGQTGSQNAASTNQNGTATSTPQQTPGATPRATQRTAGNGPGVPWGWIIVGIIVIAIILALIGRGGTDRVERRETVERDRTTGPTVITERRDEDDIRRVG